MAKTEEKSRKELLDEISQMQESVSSLENAIIELKLKAESMRKNELNLLSLLRSMNDLLFVIGLDGSFNRYYQSPTRSDLFLPPKEFLGKHFSDVLPTDVTELMQKAINAVEAYGKTQEFDFYMTINRREYWFNSKLSLYKPASGDYFGYLCENA